MNYAHVGKITMKIEKSQGIIGGLGTLFSGNVKYDDVDSFEIKIIPKRAKDIKDTFAGLMQAREGANKFLIGDHHIHPERIPEGHHEPSTHLRR